MGIEIYRRRGNDDRYMYIDHENGVVTFGDNVTIAAEYPRTIAFKTRVPWLVIEKATMRPRHFWHKIG